MEKQPILFVILLLPFCFVQCQKDASPSDPENTPLTNLPHNPTFFSPTTPQFFDPLPVPADNPISEEGVELGRHLFYDSILSQDNLTSCSSCHKLARNFSNELALSTGGNGLENQRSTMTLTNVGYVRTGYFWDGRAATIEAATEEELTHPNAINGIANDFLPKIRENENYQKMFRAAFPIENTNQISVELVAKALGQFQRTFISGASKLDQAQDPNGFVELTELELDGYFLFFREQNFTLHPGCSHCHEATYYDGDNYYNNGIEEVDDLTGFPDLGRGEVTGIELDNGRFRAPSLRNIARTAPYMHDGRFDTLEEVLAHYESGGHGAANLDQEITGFPLTDYERQSLIAFINTLTDEDFLNKEELKSPF